MSRSLRRASAAALLVVLVACTGGDGGRAPVPSGGVTQPRSGGRITVGVLGEPPTLDPYAASATDLTRALARPLYPSLYAMLPDGTTRPELAESLEVIPGGARVRLVDARWSDGEPITALDVAASARRARPPSGFAGLDVRVIDERNLELHGVVDNWGATLATAAPVLPNGKTSRVIGGPFGLADKVPGLRFVYRPNPRYFGPRPYLDSLEVTFVEGSDALISLLERGDIDVASIPATVNLEERLVIAGVEHAVARGWASIRLDASRSGLTPGSLRALWGSLPRASFADRFLASSGRVSDTLTPSPGMDGADGPWRSVRGVSPLGIETTLVAPDGDELLLLLQRALFEELEGRGAQIELAGMEARAFYAHAPDGIAIERAEGSPAPAEGPGPNSRRGLLPLFHVDTFLAWRPGIHGPAPNPTLEGPLWNVVEWWRG